MDLNFCLCAASPALDLKTKVVVFMHYREFPLITNTGVLAHRVLKNSQLVFRGHPRLPPVVRSDFLNDAEIKNTFVLYPAGEAKELNDDFLKKNPGPLTVICPDGHWSQANKILRREPALKRLPCVKLPENANTTYRLRRNPMAGRVCTFEAIAQALSLTEGPDVYEKLDAIFQKTVTRLLWMRGKISEKEVIW
jgi:DTW domain-containing protein YfiP